MRNGTVNTVIKATAGIVVIAVAYCVGAGIIPAVPAFSPIDHALAKPDRYQRPTVEATLVATHTVEYIEQKVVEKEYVDVTRTIPVSLRNFSTLEELEDWICRESDRIVFRFESMDRVIDCDDYALEMQRKALEDGFLLSFNIIGVKEYNSLFAIPIEEVRTLHAVNLAVIGNSIFYIEPQTGEVVHAAYLD